MKNNLPSVSIIIPSLNEEKYVGKCLDSIIGQDYPRENLEVIVVDGMSEDGTRDIIEQYIRKYPFVRLLDNPKKITPCALNIGIKSAKGEIIAWLSAHNEYVKTHISKCVKYLKELNADAVGGVIKPVPKNSSFIGKTICAAISHPFGVGNSALKVESKDKTPHGADTAFGVCYRGKVFEKIGIFNEQLIRGQDMEFGLRLKRNGLKTLLAPEIISYYHVNSDLRSFIKHSFNDGVWAILPFKYTNIIPVSLRHLIPLVFVLGVLCAGILSIFSALFGWVFLFVIASYFTGSLYFSIKIAFKQKDARFIFAMPFIFAIFHFSYGLGSIWGLMKCFIIGKDRKSQAEKTKIN